MGASDLQPTIIGDSVAEGMRFSTDSLDVSKANVGFVAGDRPRFADETAALLRSRLTAAALALVITLAAANVGNALSGITSLWWLRATVLLVLVACFLILRNSRPLSLSQLRWIELVVFGLVLMQVLAMMATRIAGFVVTNDVAAVAAAKHLFFGAWCVLIFLYGIFMPNTWKRGAAIMLPAALLPYLVLGYQSWQSPEFASLISTENTSSPVPLPVVAALVAVYGTHVINSARREAFKARQFGQYRLLEKLGSGGMGEVYKAEHVLLKRPCAMKLIKPSSEADATAIAHFETEVKATAKLTHWNTVEIYDYGHTEDGTFYYVMELLPGMSLDDLVEREGPLSPARVVHLLRQVCGALKEAHDAGLIHRDIKPANIYAAQRGGVFDVAKLLDFGLVKENSGNGHAEARQGSFSGTPLYMSPEQASAYDAVDGRADIYSLGAVAYHLLTGKPPFAGENVMQLLKAHARSEVTPPSEIEPNVPTDLEQIILRCLKKSVDERFPNAESLKQALARCECANQWTPEQAGAWWSAYESSQQRQAIAKQNADTVTIVQLPSDS